MWLLLTLLACNTSSEPALPDAPVGSAAEWATFPAPEPEDAAVDFRTLHERGWVQWMNAFNAGRESDALAVIRDDKPLASVPEQIHEIRPKVLDTVATFQEPLDGWNLEMKRRDQPWRVEAREGRRGGETTISLRTYRVLYRVPFSKSRGVDIGYRADGLRTVDRSPLSAMPVGTQNLPMVQMDALVALFVTEIWPALDQDNPQMWALKAELGEHLSPAALSLLVDAAALERELKLAVLDVNKRGHCSKFRIGALPWYGLDDATWLKYRKAIQDEGQCPRLRTSELDRIVAVSQKLQGITGLEAALEKALAHFAHATAIRGVHRLFPTGRFDTEAHEMAGWAAALSAPEVDAAAFALICAQPVGGAPPSQSAVLQEVSPEGCGVRGSVLEAAQALTERYKLAKRVRLEDFPTALPARRVERQDDGD